MTWWRRDPSLSPINRYAQRLLRSDESALRTRCFSRTPSQNEEHEGNGGSKRPSGMSNLEWMQMQQYNRWRKRFTEDPYQALFGASNDMLSGKGLMDWEWISKTFPKWMLREMEAEENSTTRSRNRNNSKAGSHYPKRVEITDEQPKMGPSHFRQPSIRATRLDRDDTVGIVSPSDLRRPQEQPHLKVVGQHTETTLAIDPQADAGTPAPKTSIPRDRMHSGNSTTTDSLSKMSSSSDVPFNERFRADQHQGAEPPVQHESKRSIWRETALQRRSSQLPESRIEKRTDPAPPPNDEFSTTQEVSASTSSIEHMDGSAQSATVHPTTTTADEVRPMQTSSTATEHPDEDIAHTRSTSKVLSQLPQDDIDFLSAEEIRASMASKKGQLLAKDKKQAERQKLEATFSDTHKADQNIEPLMESQVINNQLVRRLEREMQSSQVEPGQSIQTSMKQSADPTLAPEAPIESTVDRLVNLVSSHFWQVPAEAESIQKTRLFFEQFMVRVRRGRNAMKQITEDLEKDIPASKDLLKALQEHDELLDSTVRKLQRRLDSGDRQGTASNQKINERLRAQIKHTDNKLNSAFVALNEIELPGGNARNVLPSFKRRLRTAAKVATKNLELTRQIAWSMQTHLEDPEIDRTILAGYQAVANSLLVVKHTQLALSLLLDRAMLVYGVPKAGDDGLVVHSTIDAQVSPATSAVIEAETSLLSEVDKARIRTKVAADERLANEVNAQKTSMRGLSDDGYAHAPKSVTRKPFEDRSPLAHSLFRPFGPVIESLGRETATSAETVKAIEATKKKASDAKLVAEIRKAYEDTYGPITVGHRQLADAAEQVKKEQEGDAKVFTMLKEDNVSSIAASEPPASASSADSAGVKSLQNIQAVVPAAETANQNQSPDMAKPEMTPPVIATVNIDVADLHTSEPATVASQSATPPPTSVDAPTHYTILVHDPDTGKLSITTSITGPPRDTSLPLPIHQALANLNSPAKFIPFISDGLEIVSANKDILVLRDALDNAASTRSFETVSTPNSPPANETTWKAESSTVNPIDGTTRLSPTGYVGPEESPEQLEREFEERRQAAEKFSTVQNRTEQEEPRSNDEPKRRRGGAGGVVKTAIWAAAACYVAGVVGEIVTGA